METVELFAKGCLGTCWYGKYHYLEPWAGCGHDCPYCYARFRSPVRESLRELQTEFSSPALLYPRTELLARISETANSGQINILKLCRFTDIFSPTFVKDGLALEILELLAASKVQRIIITTKGLPDRRLLELMAAHPEKFSYNAAARTNTLAAMAPNLAPLEKRLEAAAQMSRAGLLTTIHLDPFVAGFDDQPEVLRPLLTTLREKGLRRVMFSYLLLSDEMVFPLEKVLGAETMGKIRADYDEGVRRRYLPLQGETTYWSLKPEVMRRSAESTAEILTRMEFEFVLCSLKNLPGLDTSRFPRSHLCDGSFYA